MKIKNRIPRLEMLIIVIGILILGACSKGTINIQDDKTSTLPLIESSSHTPTDATTPTEQSEDTPTVTETEPTTTETGTSLLETTTASVTMNPADANQITLTAQALLGIPFADGGASPEAGFDSSGFIYYVLRENGFVNCSRAIGEQAVMGNLVDSIAELKSGDLVFFSDSGERAQYGGIYIGDGIMVSCSTPGDKVKEVNINVNYYLTHFYTGVRVL